ncbi:hypothetical protein GW916_08085 [bacterium]|nr:hypothetical protein [bacterium]
MFKIGQILVSVFVAGFSATTFAEGVCTFCEESQRAIAFFQAGHVCGSVGSTCRLAHMSSFERRNYSNGVGEGTNNAGLAMFDALERSSHPEVNLSRYLELEKGFAERGEPVDANNLIKFMNHLATNPGTKCEFSGMSASKGAYGMSCGSGGSKAEFPGLSGKLLKENFASFDKNPPPPPEPEKAPPPAETEVAADPVIEAEEKDAEVVENPPEDFLSIAEAPEEEVKTAIIPNSLATDGVRFTDDEESVLPSAEKRDPASIGVR